MKTYLVTGGCGFIGANFIHYIFRKYGEQIRILNLDKLTYAGDPKNLADVSDRPNYTFIKGDICDKELVNRIFRDNLVDYVVHFAAESHVDLSIAAADAFVTTNILGTFTLLDAAKRAWPFGEPYLEGVRY
ncbi:MAG TPA: GDP-mannose 4,6-dehydratase, partial [Methanocorpusculum sp.]|nr:GDP-mannose 4,6-dehydratase [Methanocorpusculum sp.]